MRQSEHPAMDAEFPGRYTLDEARFSGGRERIFSKEDTNHESTSHHA